MVEQLTQATASSNSKVGVDVESLSALNIDNETFIERNFTEKEIAYCQKSPNPQASFTGKWSAKEAVFKSLGVKGEGAGAPLKDIEIINDESGAPTVQVCSYHYSMLRSVANIHTALRQSRRRSQARRCQEHQHQHQPLRRPGCFRRHRAMLNIRVNTGGRCPSTFTTIRCMVV